MRVVARGHPGGEQLPGGPRDQEALEALAAGDRERALGVVMDAYGPALYRYCRQLVGDADLADEAHQMTFVQAYASLEGFAGRSSLRVWLYSIARHRCLDLLKTTRRRQRRFQQADEGLDVADGVQDAQQRMFAAEEARALEQCLQELRPGIRDVVLLRYREGLTYPEMAIVCEEQPATLQARVARALPLLRACLARMGIGR